MRRMAPPRVSIALCTYNGAAFLQEQLDSYVRQSKRPDELIVCDDRSTDGTVDILEAFARTAPFEVKVAVNEVSLGVKKNFERAVERCTGEIIFLSDQDDVWTEGKIGRVLERFDAKPQAAVVVSDATIVNRALAPVGHTHWEGMRFDRRWQERVGRDAFSTLMKMCIFSGATMAFRSEYRSLLLPFPDEWFHDRWIATLLAAVAPMELIAEPLNLYRQHDGNVAGGGAFSNVGFAMKHRELRGEVFDREAAIYSEMLERLKGREVGERLLSLLREKVEFLKRRAAMRRTSWKKPGMILSELARGRYHRLARGWVTVARDLVG